MKRKKVIESLLDAGRENSTATVLFHSAVSEKTGLGVTDMKTLDYLARLGPLTAGEISEHTGLTTASVTSLIDRLEGKGFVRRVRDTADRRKVIVEPVMDHREGEFAHLFQSFVNALMILLERYSDAQLRTIADFLSRSAAVIRKEAVKLRETDSTE